MARRRRRKPNPLAQGLAFWAGILVICGIVAFISFRVGRDWIGKHLGSFDMSKGAPRIVAEASNDPENAARREQEAKAPKSAKVSVQDREPSEAEKRRLEREEDEGEPQDGAQLNAEEGRDRRDDEGAADDSGASTDEEPPEEADSRPQPKAPRTHRPQRSGAFTVTAGAFSDRQRASKVASELSAKGYNPYVETVRRNGETLHRVNVAVVGSRSKADELRDELAGTGVQAAIVAGD